MSDRKQIALIGGDGVGREVVAVGRRVLEALARARGLPIELTDYDLGADRFLRDGVTFPEDVARALRERTDAVLLGALGDPRVPDMRHARDILFGLRFGLDLFANVRPVVCLHDRLMPLAGRTARDCRFVVFRENTEGAYVGAGGRIRQGTPDEIAITEIVQTRRGVERIVRAAFDYARARGLRRVHLADKHNAMPHAHGLWRDTFAEVARDYPDVGAEHMFMDALMCRVVLDPGAFEVIVTSNLLGDLLTDLGAALQGGMGMAASANLHPGRVSMFEPVHGSAPDLAGRDLANPFATVLSVGMMLTYLGWPDEEARLVGLVREGIELGRCTPDVGGSLGTRAVGDWLVEQLACA